MRIAVINGPNLNLLGEREPEIYGKESLADINSRIKETAAVYNAELSFFQSNVEGAIINEIHRVKDFDGIIINPGAYSHYSYAIRDALSSVPAPAIEIHISNIFSRDDFRHVSVTGGACKAVISGLGTYGYISAVKAFCER